MSRRLAKKNSRKQTELPLKDNQIASLLSIYDHQLDNLYRQLSRKSSAINWIEQSYEYLSFASISNIENKESWLLPADNNNRNKNIVITPEGALSISQDLLKDDRFYLQTGSMNINALPLAKESWVIKGGCKYQLHITAKYSENRPDVSLFIIQYDNEKRVAHKFQQVYNGLNKIEIETDVSSCFFSIALRFKGSGSVIINPIKVYAEETLPIDIFDIESDHQNISNIVELKAKALARVFEDRIQSLPDSPDVQKNNLNELKDKLATALFEKQRLERSIQYRIGKSFVDAGKNKFSGLLTLPKKLIKIRAANRKGKFKHEPINNNIKQTLLESVGVYNEEKPNKEITWPAFEPKAKPRNQHINIVSISDKFTYECFRYEANFIPLTKKNWKAEIDASNPVMFFVESAWNGNDGEWTYTMASYKKHLGDPLREAIKYCKSKNIPVVFWNKEDPTNYDVFIDVAADCDYIFTTDGNIIEKYKSRVGHERVYPLAFAAQPAIHNPIRDKRKNLPTYEVCFAGSWYNNGHDTRRIQTEIVLGGAMERELHIYDRMLHAKQHRESRIFPAQYQPFIVGSLNYEQMVTAYRQYKVFLNINTVQDSPTMFSRRVFEILACGTPVVSTPSDGMKKMLGEHVYVVNNNKETKDVIQKLFDSEQDREKYAHISARHCLQHHSYQQRFKTVLETIGLQFDNEQKDKVSVVMCTNRPKNIDLMIENYLRQIHKNKELLIILNNDEFDINSIKQKVEGIPSVQVYQLSQNVSLGDCLNHGVAKASGNYIAKMDDDDIYGRNYLSDALIAFDFSGADVVGKDSYFCYVESKKIMAIKQPSKDNRYSDFVSGGTLIIRKEVFNKIKFHNRNRGEDTNFLKDCKENGFVIYSSDKYNFIQMRYSNTTAHTWTIQDDDYLKNCIRMSESLMLELADI